MLNQLNEAGGKKGRKVTRYFVKPQQEFLSKKDDLLNFLIDHNNEDCVIYTLKNLEDNKDINKLSNADIIYKYKDGILYDKNDLRIMDYNLYIKHEEEREKIDIGTASDAKIEKVYDDRLTGNMNEEITTVTESVSQEINKAYNEISKRYNIDLNELVYGKNGFMATVYPDGLPDFKGDIIYHEDYWAEFCTWLKDNYNIDLCPDEIDETAIIESCKRLDENELNLDFTEPTDNIKCCICGEELTGYGNNPFPVKKSGLCCDACNLHFVIPARAGQLNK